MIRAELAYPLSLEGRSVPGRPRLSPDSRSDGFHFLHIQLPEVVQFRSPPDCAVYQPQPAGFLADPGLWVRGAGFFLGTTEALFGTLILLGFWSRRLGILGALGSIVTFLGTVTIIPFFPNAWATEAGGFPAMYLPVGFLVKDFLFLAASFYLLKQDLTRAARAIARN